MLRLNKKIVPLVSIVFCGVLMLSAAPQQAQAPVSQQGNTQAPDPSFELPGRPPAGAQGPGLPTGPTLAPANGNREPAANAGNQPAAPAPAANNPGAPTTSGN